MTLVEGPVWAEPGQTGLSVLYPLRVENAMFALVDRFLPGVISTTPHARYLGLHAMVRAEAIHRSLDLVEGRELMRRCEAVIAAITVHHKHTKVLPEGHGQSKVQAMLTNDGGIDVAAVAVKGAYSDAVSGFYGTYRGPEIVLGVIAPGAEQTPGERYDDSVVRAGLGDVLPLADQAHVSGDELRDAGHLCPCAAVGAETDWLRSVICGTAGGDDFAVADEARRDTARIVARILYDSGKVRDIQRTLRHGIAFGKPLGRGLLAGIDLSEAWRGAILRNYSIEAWRNLWWWIVEQLKEPQTAVQAGAAVGDQLPADWTVGDLSIRLPKTTDAGSLLPVEADLRAAEPRPHLLTELQILALGAQRLDDTDGRTRKVLAGDDDDDLSPLWMAGELGGNAARPLRTWAAELTERLLWRSHRVALTKLDLRDPTRPRLPAQVIERDGRWSLQAAAGSGPVGLRLPSFASMLAGCGVLGSDPGGWWLTEAGESFLG